MWTFANFAYAVCGRKCVCVCVCECSMPPSMDSKFELLLRALPNWMTGPAKWQATVCRSHLRQRLRLCMTLPQFACEICDEFNLCVHLKWSANDGDCIKAYCIDMTKQWQKGFKDLSLAKFNLPDCWPWAAGSKWRALAVRRWGYEATRLWEQTIAA